MPLISVIITCFNHALYIREAVNSVISQTYKNVEIIIIDDCSTDRSKEVITEIQQENPRVLALYNTENRGVCYSFNKAFHNSGGDYIIDLAADDYLFPHKIAAQLEKFQTLPPDYGVVYSDLLFVDENGENTEDNRRAVHYPEGNVFSQVVARHCLFACTMLVKRDVYLELKGYDETLAYEDFDFFVRAARTWNFACIKEPLMAKREVKNSLGKQFFKKGNLLGLSTLKVCQKIKILAQNKEELRALKQRIRYEAFDAFRNGEWRLAWRFLTV